MRRPVVPTPAAPAATTGAAIVVEGVSHTYGGSTEPVTVLRDVSLELPDGGYAAITGASGAGKTTLLSLLGGLERPQRGRVVVAGEDLSQLEGDRLAGYRQRTVGFVFQHFGLLDTLTAIENVELAIVLSGTAGRRQRRRRAMTLLEEVGLGHRAAHRPGMLSGGERQRVAIARALANEPKLVLADEPTGNLDLASGQVVLELLERLPASGRTLVVVTHDAAVAARAEHHLHMDRGAVRAMRAQADALA